MRAGGYSGVYSPLFADFNGDNKGDLFAIGSVPPSGIGSNLMLLKGINTGVTSVSNNVSTIATGYSLGQNYPNPFNPSTKISFELPQSSFVKLTLYDAAGKEVTVLLNEQNSAGKHSVQFNADGLSSGIYFYKLSASSSSENFDKTMKMILLK